MYKSRLSCRDQLMQIRITRWQTPSIQPLQQIYDLLDSLIANINRIQWIRSSYLALTAEIQWNAQRQPGYYSMIVCWARRSTTTRIRFTRHQVWDPGLMVMKRGAIMENPMIVVVQQNQPSTRAKRLAVRDSSQCPATRTNSSARAQPPRSHH